MTHRNFSKDSLGLEGNFRRTKGGRTEEESKFLQEARLDPFPLEIKMKKIQEGRGKDRCKHWKKGTERTIRLEEKFWSNGRKDTGKRRWYE